MTGREKHLHRDAVARLNGFRGVPVPDDAEWAGRRLPEVVDEMAALAALRLRGLPDPAATAFQQAKEAIASFGERVAINTAQIDRAAEQLDDLKRLGLKGDNAA